MNMTQANTLSQDVTLEIARMRAAAEDGLRVLQDLELGWIAGGDTSPNWDGTTPPPTP